MSEPQAETILFAEGNVSVSNLRFIVGPQTYAMSGITSVKFGRTDPSRLGPVILLVLGLLSLGAKSWAVGIVCVGVAITWFVQQRPSHNVVLSTSAGERQALTSPDGAYIQRVVGALNDAIVMRG